MKIAFFRASYGDWMDWVIDFLSGRGGYSHVETIFSNGECFSCSIRDKGCRFKKFNEKEYPLAAWHMIDFPIDIAMSADEEQLVYDFCKKQDGKKYDLWGAIGVVVHEIKADRKAWFCSELQTVLLQLAGFLEDVKPRKQSPNHLFKLIQELINDQQPSFDKTLEVMASQCKPQSN